MAQMIRIDEHTWRFEDGFVRFFLLEGKEKACLIDSGVNCPDACRLASSVTPKPLMLVNTHGDGDHSSGTAAFSQIHVHPLDYVNCNFEKKYPNTALVEINDADVIDLGERPLKFVWIPGHTMGSIAILDIKSRVLYSGDSVQKGHIYMFGGHRDPERFSSSLDKLIELSDEYDWIYASHDEFCLPGDYVLKVKEAWKRVQSGKVEYSLIDLFGNKVKSYSLADCGFYL